MELRPAEADKENAPSAFNRVDDLAAAAKRKYVLRFGDNKAASDMQVGHIKAIFGKFVREGKLTLEDKSSTKVLIKVGSARYCTEHVTLNAF